MEESKCYEDFNTKNYFGAVLLFAPGIFMCKLLSGACLSAADWKLGCSANLKFVSFLKKKIKKKKSLLIPDVICCS